MALFTEFPIKRAPVEPLGSVGIARQLAVGAVSANQALTANITRISIFANGTDMRFAIGNVAQVATLTNGVATSHFIAAGERLDIAIPSNITTPNIAAIAVIATGTLEISELA